MELRNETLPVLRIRGHGEVDEPEGEGKVPLVMIR
jgi:hypothetical protein